MVPLYANSQENTSSNSSVNNKKNIKVVPPLYSNGENDTNKLIIANISRDTWIQLEMNNELEKMEGKKYILILLYFLHFKH